MKRPRFSQTLVTRRRDLGLSIEQAASVLKMKEQVLRAFESGDWQAIPRAGYAQGMLSSYARYLGLNPRDVVDEFKQDLYNYTHDAPVVAKAPSDDRARKGYADRYQSQPVSRRPTDDIDLYGSAGPAGSVSMGGTFDDELRQRLVRERGGHRGAGYSERYLQEQSSTTRHHPRVEERAGSRRYTSRAPERTPRTPNREARGRARSSRAREEARRPRDHAIRERSVAAGQYRDDLRYDEAEAFEAASTERGRRASRHIASTERPRSARGGEGRSRSSRSSRQPTMAETLFTSRKLILIVVIGLFVIVMAAVLFTVNSCVSHVTSTEKPEVPVSTTTPVEDEGGAGETTDQDEGGAGGSASQPETPPSATQTTPSLVTISVADGQVSWVEVVMGDVSLVAQTVTGPWEKTFTPTAAMEIQASDASAVTVTADGKTLSFDSKASGVGVITIPGPDQTQGAGGSDTGDTAQTSGSGSTGDDGELGDEALS